MKNIKNIRSLFGDQIGITFRTGAKILTDYPKSAMALAKITGNMRRAETSRVVSLDTGIEVPPLLLVSTTEN